MIQTANKQYYERGCLNFKFKCLTAMNKCGLLLPVYLFSVSVSLFFHSLQLFVSFFLYTVQNFIDKNSPNK